MKALTSARSRSVTASNAKSICPPSQRLPLYAYNYHVDLGRAVSEYEFLRWELDGHVATVWLDRPPVNAVDQAMYRELRRLFLDVSQLGDDVRAIVLAGAGKHFCAGNDLNEFLTMTPANAPGRMREVREAFF